MCAHQKTNPLERSFVQGLGKMCGSVAAVIAAFWTLACDASDSENLKEESLPQCVDIESADISDVIKLRVENQRAETVYIAGQGGCFDPEMIALLNGEDQIIETTRSCDLEQDAESCAPANAYKLPSGASQVLEFEAASYGTPQCQVDEMGDDIGCTSRGALPTGPYHFQVSWYPALFDDTHDCTPETEASGCFILGVAGKGERTVEAVDFEYPADGAVLLTIN